ncbi:MULTISPECIES: response regulator [Methanocalculus]|uniref:ATP-binding response regulator n=1 Tax=Methanocalculus TaxID=71151 RepID=UPI0020A1B14F|nr:MULTISPECIES: response regulator [unclassified Methanocalculus]MCP1662845.1 PAS domain S-box-containing protein [Methanocalculus sp. AMF5]
MAEPRVWIVEDESIVAMDLQRRLQSRGYSVLGISSYAEEAIEKIRQHKPDIIIMDIVLKGEMDGITASGIIKEEMGIPIVYLTAYADRSTIDRAKLTEPYGYILKPFEEPNVISVIEIALHKAAMEKKIRESDRWIQTMINSIGEGIIATDTAGRVKFMNPVAEELTGVAAEEAIMQPASRILAIESEDTSTEAADPIENALLTEDTITSEDKLVLVAKDGTRRYVEYTAARIHDDEDTIYGAVLAIRDISERVRIEEFIRRVVPGRRETPLIDLLKAEEETKANR